MEITIRKEATPSELGIDLEQLRSSVVSEFQKLPSTIPIRPLNEDLREFKVSNCYLKSIDPTTSLVTLLVTMRYQIACVGWHSVIIEVEAIQLHTSRVGVKFKTLHARIYSGSGYDWVTLYVESDMKLDTTVYYDTNTVYGELLAKCVDIIFKTRSR